MSFLMFQRGYRSAIQRTPLPHRCYNKCYKCKVKLTWMFSWTLFKAAQFIKNTTMETKLIEDSGRFTHEITVHIMQLLFYFLKFVAFFSLQKLMMSQNIFTSSDCKTFTFRNPDYGNETVKTCVQSIPCATRNSAAAEQTAQNQRMCKEKRDQQLRKSWPAGGIKYHQDRLLLNLKHSSFFSQKL